MDASIAVQPQPDAGRVAELKRALLANLATVEELAVAWDVSIRSAYRLVRLWDVPYVLIGAKRHFRVDAARKAMEEQQVGGKPPPRGPGRPRKAP